MSVASGFDILSTSETCLGYVLRPKTRHFGHFRKLFQMRILLGDLILWAPQKLVSDTCLADKTRHFRRLRNSSQIRVLPEGYTFWAPEELVSDMFVCPETTSETCLGYVSCLGIKRFGHIRSLSRTCVSPGNRHFGHIRNLYWICVLHLD